ncbi:MAG TPA: hypothetical protein VF601_23560 [Beijerinckiaceae bacterium]|jgi:hypothetical protein
MAEAPPSKEARQVPCPAPSDRRELPKDAGKWAREFIGGLEDLRRGSLVQHRQGLAAEMEQLQDERRAMAGRDGVPPEVLALLDGAIAAAGRDAEIVDSTLRATEAAPRAESGGYALAGVLATADGRGPADGAASLVVAAKGATPAKVATARIGPDGSLYLTLSAKTAKQYAGQSAAVEITLAGKPFPVDARVTVTPGQTDTVRLPVLPDESRPCDPQPPPARPAPAKEAPPKDPSPSPERGSSSG